MFRLYFLNPVVAAFAASNVVMGSLPHRRTLPARADSAVSPGAPAPAEESAPAPVVAPAAGTRTYNERDFILEVPRSFKEVRSDDNGPAGFGAGGKPKSTYGVCAVLPVSQTRKPALTLFYRCLSNDKAHFLCEYYSNKYSRIE